MAAANHVGKPDGSSADGAPRQGPAGRRHPLRAIPVTLVLLVIAGGLGLALIDHWRRGSAVIAGAGGLAALLRLVLPTSAVGVLAVRSRVFDVVFLLAVSAFLAAAAIINTGR